MGTLYEVNLMNLEKVDLGRVSRGARTIAFAKVGNNGANIMGPCAPEDANVRTSGHWYGHGRYLSIPTTCHGYSFNVSVDRSGWAIGRYLADWT